MLPAGVHRCGALLVAEAALSAWSTRLRDAVTAEHDQHPLSAGLPRKAALDLLDAPGEALPELLERADLVERDGRVLDPLRSAQLGPAETAIAALEQHLGEEPFASPSADHLTALGLGPEELAAAARLGRVLRLPGVVILLPTAPPSPCGAGWLPALHHLPGTPGARHQPPSDPLLEHLTPAAGPSPGCRAPSGGAMSGPAHRRPASHCR